MKESKYRIKGKVFRVSEGLGYDPATASLVPVIVVARPYGTKELSFASAASMSAGVEKLATWVSVPVERMQEFAI